MLWCDAITTLAIWWTSWDGRTSEGGRLKVSAGAFQSAAS